MKYLYAIVRRMSSLLLVWFPIMAETREDIIFETGMKIPSKLSKSQLYSLEHRFVEFGMFGTDKERLIKEYMRIKDGSDEFCAQIIPFYKYFKAS